MFICVEFHKQHCNLKNCEFLQITELASTLSFGSRSSSLDSLSSVDSAPGTPVRGSPVPQRASPLHTRFRLSAKKALLLWVQDQCQKYVSAPQFNEFYLKWFYFFFFFFLPVYIYLHYILYVAFSPLSFIISLILYFPYYSSFTRVGSSVSVKDFKSSWRSGVAFHAILCSLRPDLVDVSLTEGRSNLENLEEAFRIAQQELGIPRLLEPEGGCNFFEDLSGL